MKTPWWRMAVREVLSFTPRLGFQLLCDRPQGITAIMRVKNEEDWLELSVRSLAAFADQIVIGDNCSTDGTAEILKRLVQEYPRQITVLSYPNEDIVSLTNNIIEKARYRWIIRWDADFVAQTEGPNRIEVLKEWLMKLSPKRYYLAYLNMVEVSGDLWHQNPQTAKRSDAQVWMTSPHLRYVYDPTGFESPAVPCWYAVRFWEKPCFFHVNVKSNKRMFESSLWKRYLTREDKGERISCEDYVKRLSLKELGAEGEAAVNVWVKQYLKTLAPFAAKEYPVLLRPYLENPRYRIRYEKGEIAGRDTY